MFGRARRKARVVTAPAGVREALRRTLAAGLGTPAVIDQIKIVEDSKWANLLSGITRLFSGGRKVVLATTQRDTIYLSSHLTAPAFFADSKRVLHEYYHVANQWNNGRLGNLSYLLSPSKWEREATDFADECAALYETFRREV